MRCTRGTNASTDLSPHHHFLALRARGVNIRSSRSVPPVHRSSDSPARGAQGANIQCGHFVEQECPQLIVPLSKTAKHQQQQSPDSEQQARHDRALLACPGNRPMKQQLDGRNRCCKPASPDCTVQQSAEAATTDSRQQGVAFPQTHQLGALRTKPPEFKQSHMVVHQALQYSKTQATTDVLLTSKQCVLQCSTDQALLPPRQQLRAIH